jgi:hypothetical protein
MVILVEVDVFKHNRKPGTWEIPDYIAVSAVEERK